MEKAQKIAVIGTGYVGLVSGVCLAELGNKVICVDINQQKIENLKNGIVPFYESGLEDMIKENVKKENLFFSTDLAYAISESDIIFVAVGTPASENGAADLSYVENVAEDIGRGMKAYKIVVIKSTVPPKTCKRIKKNIEEHYKGNFDIVSNPEFLREGSAILDFMKPDRVILGVENEEVKEKLRKLYEPLNAPIHFTSLESSEMTKYASNAFLATKISFINEIANLCEKIDADVEEVAIGMGLDPRIGKDFLKAGIGYGGSCFPKDVHALHQTAGVNGYDFCLLKSVIEVNNNQRKLIIKKIEKLLKGTKGKTLCVWGLAFKANTDDVRESAAIEIIEYFLGKGVKIKTYDPIAIENAKKVLPENVIFCKDAYEALEDSNLLFIATDWDEYKKADIKKIKNTLKEPVIVDGKNIFNPDKMQDAGFVYVSVGR